MRNDGTTTRKKIKPNLVTHLIIISRLETISNRQELIQRRIRVTFWYNTSGNTFFPLSFYYDPSYRSWRGVDREITKSLRRGQFAASTSVNLLVQLPTQGRRTGPRNQAAPSPSFPLCTALEKRYTSREGG